MIPFGKTYRLLLGCLLFLFSAAAIAVDTN